MSRSLSGIPATNGTISDDAMMVATVAEPGARQVSLVVLAVGAGSLFFSHVNDAGLWLVNH